MSKTIITPFLAIQNQLKVWHWITNKYSQHEAFGKTYEALDGVIDEFIEVYAGRYGKSSIASSSGIDVQVTINCSVNYETAVEEIDTFITFLYGNLLDVVKSQDTDLLNIRDTIVGHLNRLKYLLTLA